MRSQVTTLAILITAILHGLCALGGLGGGLFCFEADGRVQIEFGEVTCNDLAAGAQRVANEAHAEHLDDCAECVDVSIDATDASLTNRLATPHVTLYAAPVALVSRLASSVAHPTYGAAFRAAQALLPESAPLAARRTILLRI